MKLGQNHIDALDEAELRIQPRNYERYLDIKAFFLKNNGSKQSYDEITKKFAGFYGLNRAGLGETFQLRFFEILFDRNTKVQNPPDYKGILNDLNSNPIKRGHTILPLSFVSKLVAVHFENKPIYDRHVCSFFGEKVPESKTPVESRIKWYLDFLDEIAADYTSWSNMPQTSKILDRFKLKDNRLKECHDNRLLDFLVWKVGNQKLLIKNEK
jgi:hypothetical protein